MIKSSLQVPPWEAFGRQPVKAKASSGLYSVFFVECKEMMVVTPHSDPSQRDLGAFWAEVEEEEVEEDQVSPCHDDDVDGD